MKTEIKKPSYEVLCEAAELIKKGEVVAIPTETVYGLAANAYDSDACAKIFTAKGRPQDNPLIIHICDLDMLRESVREIPPLALTLAEHFWSGSLTMIFPKKDIVPDTTSGGLDTVAVRMPDNQDTLNLIKMCGVPLAAPSANLSGSPSPTRAKDVIADMEGRIDAIISGDDCRVGIESTVVDMTGDVPTILRPGIITAEALEAAIGKKVKYDESLKEDSKHVQLDPAAGVSESDFQPKSPGMKYKHYAPKADMIVIEGERSRVKAEIERLKKLNESIGNNVGVLLFEEQAFIEAAHDFFAKLRDLDAQGVDLILAGALSDTDGVGFAVMNRMLKSAGYNIARV